jgi:hypothetical protein
LLIATGGASGKGGSRVTTLRPGLVITRKMDTAFPRKPSGNMRHEVGDQQSDFPGGIQSSTARQTIPATVPTVTILAPLVVITPSGTMGSNLIPPRWAVSPPMATVYIVWQGMSGNGATTGIQIPITVPVQQTILLDLEQVFCVLFAAAAGSAAGAAAVWRAAAAAALLRVKASALDFVLSWTINNPLPCFPFTLCPCLSQARIAFNNNSVVNPVSRNEGQMPT